MTLEGIRKMDKYRIGWKGKTTLIRECWYIRMRVIKSTGKCKKANARQYAAVTAWRNDGQDVKENIIWTVYASTDRMVEDNKYSNALLDTWPT